MENFLTINYKYCVLGPWPWPRPSRPWPREDLSSKSRSLALALASDFFRSLALASNVVSSASPMAFND